MKLVLSKLSNHVQFQNEIICHILPTSKAANKRLSKVGGTLVVGGGVMTKFLIFIHIF